VFNKLIKAETIRMAWSVYPRQSKLRIPIMFLLGLIGTALEALGIGLVIPVMTTMSKATTGTVQFFRDSGSRHNGWSRRAVHRGDLFCQEPLQAVL
jgi:hypothetical protein